MATVNAIDSMSDLVLLALLARERSRARPVAGVTRLQKLLFVLTATSQYRRLVAARLAPEANFQPYRMGPFTPDIYEAIQLLSSFQPPLISAVQEDDEEAGDVELTKYVRELDLDQAEPGGAPSRPVAYTLTAQGRFVAERLWDLLPAEMAGVFETTQRGYGSLPLRELLRRVYREYPEMTTRSEIKGQLGLR
jgi:hypothetical protein